MTGLNPNDPTCCCMATILSSENSAPVAPPLRILPVSMATASRIMSRGVS